MFVLLLVKFPAIELFLNLNTNSGVKAAQLFCIFDDEKNQRGLQVFDISFAFFNNIFFMQI